MKIKAVFMNQWHQPMRVKDANLGTPDDLKTVSVPAGAIFVKLEIEEEADGS